MRKMKSLKTFWQTAKVELINLEWYFHFQKLKFWNWNEEKEIFNFFFHFNSIFLRIGLKEQVLTLNRERYIYWEVTLFIGSYNFSYKIHYFTIFYKIQSWPIIWDNSTYTSRFSFTLFKMDRKTSCRNCNIENDSYIFMTEKLRWNFSPSHNDLEHYFFSKIKSIAIL